MITRTLKELEDFGFFDLIGNITAVGIYKESDPPPFGSIGPHYTCITNDVLFKETDHSKYVVYKMEMGKDMINMYVYCKE